MAQGASNEQIVEAALRVIVRRGYAGATTRDIAEEAGINEVTLFRRYGSKANLLQAVVSEEAERFATAGVVYTGDLEADLRGVLDFYLRLMANRGPVVLTLLGEIARNPDLLGIMQKPIEVFKHAAGILARYQGDGILVAEPPEQAIAALLGPLFLFGVLGHAMNVTLDPPSAALMVERFLDGRRSNPMP